MGGWTLYQVLARDVLRQFVLALPHCLAARLPVAVCQTKRHP